jgi:hypothetical protein
LGTTLRVDAIGRVSKARKSNGGPDGGKRVQLRVSVHEPLQQSLFGFFNVARQRHAAFRLIAKHRPLIGPPNEQFPDAL